MSNSVKVVDNNEMKTITSEIAIETIIANSIKIPGVKVDRQKFLAELFVKETNNIQLILDEGPVAAGIEENKLRRIAEKLILERTGEASIKSFMLGIPGGVIAAATIPADILQFYGMTLKLAQELTYLYGAKDLWVDGQVDEEMIRNNLILYCGVMFGVSGAGECVRVLTTQIAKTTLKKLPQKALTKTLWYPIIKKVGKAIGVKITKSTVAKGASKVVPVVGGVIAGALTFVSMKPMAERLVIVLNQANFHYNDEEINKDIQTMEAIDTGELPQEENKKISAIVDKGKDKIKGLFKKKEKEQTNEDPYQQLKKLKELLDMGIISQEEFDTKKKELLKL